MNNKNVTKVHQVMEYVWLIIFIGSCLWLLTEYIRSGYNYLTIKNYVVIPLIALAMFFFRRFFRKRMEARQQQDGE